MLILSPHHASHARSLRDPLLHYRGMMYYVSRVQQAPLGSDIHVKLKLVTKVVHLL